jgi:hypothetical protein
MHFEQSSNLAGWLAPILILSPTILYTTLISDADRGLLPFAMPAKGHSAYRLASLGLGERGTWNGDGGDAGGVGNCCWPWNGCRALHTSVSWTNRPLEFTFCMILQPNL